MESAGNRQIRKMQGQKKDDNLRKSEGERTRSFGPNIQE